MWNIVVNTPACYPVLMVLLLSSFWVSSLCIVTAYQNGLFPGHTCTCTCSCWWNVSGLRPWLSLGSHSHCTLVNCLKPMSNPTFCIWLEPPGHGDLKYIFNFLLSPLLFELLLLKHRPKFSVSATAISTSEQLTPFQTYRWLTTHHHTL